MGRVGRRGVPLPMSPQSWVPHIGSLISATWEGVLTPQKLAGAPLGFSAPKEPGVGYQLATEPSVPRALSADTLHRAPPVWRLPFQKEMLLMKGKLRHGQTKSGEAGSLEPEQSRGTTRSAVARVAAWPAEITCPQVRGQDSGSAVCLPSSRHRGLRSRVLAK